MIRIKERKEEIFKILEDAGRILYEESRAKIKVKPCQGPVTQGDLKVERFLKNRLKEICPQAGFLGEEEGEVKEEEWMWVVDPLDGTVNYIHHIPHFAISVSLEKNGVPFCGFIYDVSKKEIFYAIRGEGAFLNGSPIKVSNTQKLEDALLSTGFSRVPKFRERNLEIFAYLLNRTESLRRLGSAALDLAYVACGRLDGFWEVGLNPWDISAGIVLIEEAGGRVTDFKGGRNFNSRREILATNGLLHPFLLKEIGEALGGKV